MLIGGFTEVSTVDYPNEVASVVYTMGCNLFCPYCQNPTLVRKEECSMPVDRVLAVLKAGIKEGIVDAVVITGGEPTIYGRELVDFIMRVKDIGYLVKLDTNGTNPETLKNAIIAGVDYVALDIKTSEPHYEGLGKRCRVELLASIATLNLMPRGRAEFRHTCVDPFTAWLLGDFPATLKGTRHPLYLQKANLNDVLDPLFEMHAVDPLEVKEKLESLEYPKDIRVRSG